METRDPGIQDKVSLLYISLFGRAPDAQGFEHWTTALESLMLFTGDEALSIKAIVDGMSSSSEYEAIYQDLTPEQQVNLLYQNLFSRDADPDGLAFWSGKIVTGQIPFTDVAYLIGALAFGGGAGINPNDTALLRNKVDISKYLASELSTNDGQVIQNAFNDVTTDPASVGVARESLFRQLNPVEEPEVVETPVDNSPAPDPVVTPSPQNVSLTNGVDTLSGNSDGAIVSGVIAQSPNGTFQTGDSISNYSRVNVDIENTTPTVAPTLSNVGYLEFDFVNTSGGTVTVDAENWTNVGQAWIANNDSVPNAVTISKGLLSTVYGVKDSSKETMYNIGIQDGLVAGTTDTLQVALSNTGSPTDETYINSQSAVETLTIDTTGTNHVILNDLFSSSGSIETVRVTGSGTNSFDAGSYIDIFTNTVLLMPVVEIFDFSQATGNNTLSVGDAVPQNLVILGGQGNDSLQGGGGTDWLVGDAGADTLDGGAGIDSYRSGDGASISVTLNTSTNAVVTVAGGDDDTIVNIENVIGTSGNDTINGDSANNTLSGLEASDTIDGGTGNDTIIGGAGADSLTGGVGVDQFDYLSFVGDPSDSYHGAADIITDLQATDFIKLTLLNVNTFTVGSSVSVASNQYLADVNANGSLVDQSDVVISIPNATLDSNQARPLTILEAYGTSSGDSIGGGVNGDTVWGGDGNDTLDGDAGADRLYGGAGGDTMTGGAGDDILYGDNDGLFAAQTLKITSAASSAGNVSTLLSNQSIQTSVTQSDSIFDIAANVAADINLAASTNPMLAGVLSATADGGAVTINYRIDGEQSLAGFSGGATGVSALVAEVLTGTTGSTGDDDLDGGDGDDIIIAGAGNDTIVGGAGNDIINAGPGTDQISDAGVGEDIVIHNSSNSTVTIAVTGPNKLELIAYELGAVANVSGASGLEVNASLSTAGVTISGSAAGNGSRTYVGGFAADTISGGTGIDTIAGGAGADILTGGDSFDVFVYTAVAQGGNVVQTEQSIFTAGDSITDFLSGTDDFNFAETVTGTSKITANGTAINLATHGVVIVNTHLDVVVDVTDFNDLLAALNAAAGNVYTASAAGQVTYFAILDENDSGTADDQFNIFEVTTAGTIANAALDASNSTASLIATITAPSLSTGDFILSVV